MKLQLRLESKHDAPSYRPGDTVRGTLVIWGCSRRNVSKVTVTMRGRETARVSAEANGSCPNQLKYTMFKQSRHLEAKQVTGSSAEPHEHTYHCPFEFELPTSLPCACAGTCPLPPSIHADTPKARVCISYSIAARVQRRVFHRITRTTTARREIQLTGSPCITALPASAIASLPAEKLRRDSGIGIEDSTLALPSGSLPRYSPSLRMEVILPQAPVLTRGRGAPVRLVMHTPAEMLRGSGLYVRSVSMQLRMCVSLRMRNTWHHIVQSRRGCIIGGVVPIRAERFELELGDWGSFIVVHPDCKPSFASCLLNVTYSLEVAGGISKGVDGEIQYVNTSLDVLVMDPPPLYEEMDSGETGS
ncbi:hypothetical protein H634G_02504 [Metarhizium anisopliae BRIP 53293]|uniref:Arrestin-like N-terminal domain-containing protein n=1 Tax=Metarhizium anisopliae BRIP 53293 TaxID=1291518 RepID=A0A0D9PBX0_METAN|nr:hypothetical protein H634G_02504 [Metarhizium anisopliae BRIP 53293]KJK92234.1 hypothetical protein H633G_03911 [Metarhizium anisopliae BRIP 53284]